MNLSARVVQDTPSDAGSEQVPVARIADTSGAVRRPYDLRVAEGLGGSVGRALGRALAAGLQSAVRSLLRSPSGRTPAGSTRTWRQGAGTSPRPDAGSRAVGGYPGDFTGTATIEYRPDPDGHPDPGEVVWGWVPYEEDHSRGKDRPVLVIGRDGSWLLGLMLTSKDHDRDAAQEARAGRQWMDVGTGAWDARGRPSEVRLDRVLRLDPARVRREGGALDRQVFDAVAEQTTAANGWH
jgi:hypothetical protein